MMSRGAPLQQSMTAATIALHYLRCMCGCVLMCMHVIRGDVYSFAICYATVLCFPSTNFTVLVLELSKDVFFSV